MQEGVTKCTWKREKLAKHTRGQTYFRVAGTENQRR